MKLATSQIWRANLTHVYIQSSPAAREQGIFVLLLRFWRGLFALLRFFSFLAVFSVHLSDSCFRCAISLAVLSSFSIASAFMPDVRLILGRGTRLARPMLWRCGWSTLAFRTPIQSPWWLVKWCILRGAPSSSSSSSFWAGRPWSHSSSCFAVPS